MKATANSADALKPLPGSFRQLLSLWTIYSHAFYNMDLLDVNQVDLTPEPESLVTTATLFCHSKHENIQANRYRTQSPTARHHEIYC